MCKLLQKTGKYLGKYTNTAKSQVDPLTSTRTSTIIRAKKYSTEYKTVRRCICVGKIGQYRIQPHPMGRPLATGGSAGDHTCRLVYPVRGRGVSPQKRALLQMCKKSKEEWI